MALTIYKNYINPISKLYQSKHEEDKFKLAENPLLCIEDETFELLTEAHVCSWKPTNIINQGTTIEYLEKDRKVLTPFHRDGVNELFSRLSDRSNIRTPKTHRRSPRGQMRSPTSNQETILDIKDIQDETTVVFTSEIAMKR